MDIGIEEKVPRRHITSNLRYPEFLEPSQKCILILLDEGIRGVTKSEEVGHIFMG
jgi:hypothetical protein